MNLIRALIRSSACKPATCARDPVRIELPKGTYVPVFHFRTVETVSENGHQTVQASSASPAEPVSVMPAPPPLSPVDENRKAVPRFMLAALILAVLLVGIAAFWVGQTHGERAKSRHGDPAAMLVRACMCDFPSRNLVS